MRDGVLTLPYILPPYTKPRYRWSRSAGVWVLQGLHRLAPVAIFPSNLRPAEPRDFDTRIMRYRAYERRGEYSA